MVDEITYHNLDNHIPTVNTLETNFGNRDYAIFSNLFLAAAERRNANY